MRVSPWEPCLAKHRCTSDRRKSAAKQVVVAKVNDRANQIWQRALSRLSRRLGRHVPICVDLRTVTDDPVEAAYLCPDLPFLIAVPAQHCRGLHSMAFPLSAAGDHPFIRTVAEISAGVTRYDHSALYGYYAETRPTTAAEVLGLPLDALHPDLRLPPLAAALPWEFRSPAEALIFWQRICADDYRAHGFALGANDGWKAWGPVTDAAGAAEFARLMRLCQSIARWGYRRHAAGDGDIRGTILRSGTETRILLTAGQHRAAVVAALGQSHLPVRLTAAIVQRSDVMLWPNVRRGIFSPDQALQIFDRVFAGLQPGKHGIPRATRAG